jgi:hypothetical protein
VTAWLCHEKKNFPLLRAGPGRTGRGRAGPGREADMRRDRAGPSASAAGGALRSATRAGRYPRSRRSGRAVGPVRRVRRSAGGQSGPPVSINRAVTGRYNSFRSQACPAAAPAGH